MMEKAEGTAQKWVGKAQDAVGDITGDAGTQIKGKAREMAGRTQECYGETLNMVRDSAANNPMATIAVAAGIGFLIGALMTRR